MKLAIVDDHAVFREGIKKINQSRSEISVVIDAKSGKDFIGQLAVLPKESMPDIVLLDMRMPEMDGVETVRWIKAEKPEIHILMFSMFDHFELVLEFLKLGVSGFISKAADPAELFEAIGMIREKGFYYSSFIAEKVIESLRVGRIHFKPDLSYGEITRITNALTRTEKVFLKYACKGLRYSEIAEKMFISLNTVEVHRTNVFKKMNVGSSVQMILLAMKNGIVEPD